MSLEEVYSQMGGDYSDARNRFMKDTLIQKFLLKFPADPTMQRLQDALSADDRRGVFLHVHTLKGLAANLSLTELCHAASLLTEQMRPSDPDAIPADAADAALVEQVRSSYEKILSVLSVYSASLSV